MCFCGIKQPHEVEREQRRSSQNTTHMFACRKSPKNRLVFKTNCGFDGQTQLGLVRALITPYLYGVSPGTDLTLYGHGYDYNACRTRYNRCRRCRRGATRPSTLGAITCFARFLRRIVVSYCCTTYRRAASERAGVLGRLRWRLRRLRPGRSAVVLDRDDVRRRDGLTRP